MSLLQFAKSTVIPVVGLAIGCAGAIAIVGTSSEEHALLKKRHHEFRMLDAEQQKTVKASHAEYSLQTRDRQNEIVTLNQAVEADPELKKALERYSGWWSSLSRSEWESFPAMTREQQIEFARARINKQAESSAAVVVEFSGWGQTLLQPLHLTLDECERIISLSLRDVQIPDEVSTEFNQLQSPEHRSLACSLWLFDQFQHSTDRVALVLQGEKILKSVLASVSDDAWRIQFEKIIAENSERKFFKIWAFQNLLVILKQSTMVLGNRLTQEFPVSEEEIVSAFVNLEDKERQHSLMTMPSDDARTTLESLAQLNRAQTPEQKLLVKFVAFARDRQRIIGRITFQLGDRQRRNNETAPPQSPRDQDKK
jgi:hypothetical protein